MYISTQIKGYDVFAYFGKVIKRCQVSCKTRQDNSSDSQVELGPFLSYCWHNQFLDSLKHEIIQQVEWAKKGFYTFHLESTEKSKREKVNGTFNT